MKLYDLAAYAENTYGLHQEFRWPRYRNLSVIADPSNGQWLVFLMYRHIDADTGEIEECCDIRCEKDEAEKLKGFYGFSQPLQMHGEDWIGVTMSAALNDALVHEALDAAMKSAGSVQRREIVISDDDEAGYQSVSIPQRVHVPQSEKEKIPAEIAEMVQMYRPGNELEDKRRNFYNQGMFMKDYEDHAVWNGEWSRLFPVYHDLRIEQLRGYFAWRTAFRKGETPQACEGFLKIYVYEMMNQIGVSSKEEGLENLNRLRDAYFTSSTSLNGYLGIDLTEWIFDYCIYYDFPVSKTREYFPKERIEADEACSILDHSDQHSDEEVYRAVVRLCSYNIDGSRLISSDRQRGMEIIAFVWRYLSEKSAEGNYPLFQRCIGFKDSLVYVPFSNAVFYEREKHPDCDYQLDEGRIYSCRDDRWKENAYHLSNEALKNFGRIIRETDRQSRLLLSLGHAIKEKPVEQWISWTIRDGLKAYLKKKEEESRPVVNIDFSRLSSIRQDASLTRDRLLTEEEKEDDAEAEVQQSVSDESSSVFSRDEAEIIELLLEGKDVRDYLRNHHLMASVVTDAVNEKMMDVIGDSALESDGSTITIVEDYRQDLEAALKGEA